MIRLLKQFLHQNPAHILQVLDVKQHLTDRKKTKWHRMGYGALVMSAGLVLVKFGLRIEETVITSLMEGTGNLVQAIGAMPFCELLFGSSNEENQA